MDSATLSNGCGRSWPATLLTAGLLALVGCRSHDDFRFRDSQEHYQAFATQVEYPDVAAGQRENVLETPSPRTVLDSENIDYWPMSLQEAVRTALCNSQVVRDAGGMVLNGPTPATTVFDPAIRDTDPRGGTEAALSAFDATLQAGLGFEHQDRWFNNILFGGGTRGLNRQLGVFQAEVTKIGGTGTQFSMSSVAQYDNNNAPFNKFSQIYNINFEGEIRQPLLQGAGIEYNRIAGPNARPGFYNGVLLARINTDIGLADFEQSVNSLLSSVERTYWDLYVAYRDLDARRAARELALQTWRNVYTRYQAGVADQEEEARTREQFFFFNSQVLNALNGVPLPGGPIALGGGGATGVYAVERKLRWLLGLPPNDPRLIRPADEPSTVHVSFDWHASLQEALCRRVELRKQRWNIKRRELELVAARNMLKPRLDAVGQYRWLGAGEYLLGQEDIPHGSAFADLFTGDFQEWQLGLQLATPLGNRIGHTATRNAELMVSRERAIYRDQELRVTHELSEVTAELERAYEVSRSNFNARLAALQHLLEIKKKYEAGQQSLEFFLDAQRRAVEADSTYYRALIDYNMAVANYHQARGSLLEFHEVELAEGPWTDEAYLSAAKQARRFRPRLLDYTFEVPPAVSQGAVGQAMVETGPEVRTPPPVDPPGPVPQPAAPPAPPEPAIPPVAARQTPLAEPGEAVRR